MRDAFGGAFMIRLFLVFIAIYIGFTAVVLNYAKAFKVKNQIIEYLESSEISNLENMDAEQLDAMEKFLDTEILGKMNYNVSDLNICQYVDLEDDFGDTIAVCKDTGIVIEEIAESQNTEGVYYRVSTFVGWSIPFLNNLLALNGNNASRSIPTGVWQISGETRIIVNE